MSHLVLTRQASLFIWSDFEWPACIQPTTTDLFTSCFLVFLPLFKTVKHIFPSIFHALTCFQMTLKCRWCSFFSVSLSAPSLLAGPRWPASLGSPAQISVPSLFSQLPNVPSPERSYLRVKKKDRNKEKFNLLFSSPWGWWQFSSQLSFISFFIWKSVLRNPCSFSTQIYNCTSYVFNLSWFQTSELLTSQIF